MITYLFIGAYLLLSLGVGIATLKTQNNTPQEYFLASRKIGSIVLFFTLIATNFSAFAFLGFAGAGYRVGISYYPMMGFGTAFVGVSFYLIGYKVWLLGKEKGFITPSELIAERLGSQTLKLIFLAVMVIFTLPYLTLQPIGGGYLLENLTNGQIPYFAGAILLTFVVVIYVFMGGMRSVALTDVLQGILMFVLMIVALLTIANSLGGITEANRTAYEQLPELFSRQGVDKFFTKSKWFSYMVLWILSLPMFPQMFMRFYIPKTATPLKVSAILYPLITTAMFICPVLIGVWGHIPFPNLTGKVTDQVLPMMLAEYTPVWIASFVMVGALAALMSTLDSQLLALSTMLTRDVYISYFRPNATLGEQTLVGRILIVILAIVGLIIAYNPPATFTAIATQAFTGFAVLFPTVIAALYGRNINPLSCIISILVGEAALIGFALNIIPASFTFGFLPVVPIVFVSGLIIVLGNVNLGQKIKVRD
ncbi:Na+/proline symporter [Rivularia sp. PCC 7116]|uniref:sodium:solute symporter family protein n=1 Tax=Rivularia sp. PCC 7116 TaxID=373994 RepID=UPI00029F3573|nr:sodium:solute symporter family protein [Rivularia sp. PCC 7116]AFY54000.1 Na+/proline symporter [Rivularia sp. PCC 7116]